MPSDSHSASTARREPDPAYEIAASRSSHRHTLDLEARLDDVSERQRRSQALAIALLGDLALAVDQCAVGEEVERKVLGARISFGHFEELARQRGGSLDLPHRDEHLTDAAQSPALAHPVGKPSPDLEALLECLERTVVVAGCVDEHPAERVEGGRKLPVVTDGRPDTERLLELGASDVDLPLPRDQDAGRGQGARSQRSFEA